MKKRLNMLLGVIFSIIILCSQTAICATKQELANQMLHLGPYPHTKLFCGILLHNQQGKFNKNYQDINSTYKLTKQQKISLQKNNTYTVEILRRNCLAKENWRAVQFKKLLTEKLSKAEFKKHIAFLKSPTHIKYNKIVSEFYALDLNRELNNNTYHAAFEQAIRQHAQQQALILNSSNKPKNTFIFDVKSWQIKYGVFSIMTIYFCIVIVFFSLLLYRKKVLSKPLISSIILLAILIAIGEYLLFYI